MIIERKGNLIFNICFKNLIVSINNASNIFLSDIGDSLRLNEKLNKILISKFNSYGVDCCKNGISHIKFLVKYSPILSKIVDTSEFDSIEYHDDFFYMSGYFLKIDDRFFFKTNKMYFDENLNIVLPIDEDFKNLFLN